MKNQDKNPFLSEKYETLERFVSYYYQIKLIRELKPKTLLEIGIGSKVVSEYFRRMGIKVMSCDINPALSPDKVGDIRNLPFDNESFDVVTSFQVLEHIPFSNFEKALKEMNRVSRNYAIISLPFRHICFEVILKFPFIRTIFKKSFLDFCLRIPLLLYNKKNLGKHQWEMGLGGDYSLETVRERLAKHFAVIKEVRPALDSYHHFFLLKKLK